MQKALLRCVLGASLCFITVVTGNARSELTTQDTFVTIKKVLEYPIKPDILERVHATNPGFSDEYVNSLAQELKRYLALKAFLHGSSVPMFSKDVDEVWHAFILFTREYEQFCKETFGSFVHHVPTTKAEKLARTPESIKSAKEKFIADYTACFGQKPDHKIWFGRESNQHVNASCTNDCTSACGGGGGGGDCNSCSSCSGGGGNECL